MAAGGTLSFAGMRWPVLIVAGVLILCVFFTIMLAALALGPRNLRAVAGIGNMLVAAGIIPPGAVAAAAPFSRAAAQGQRAGRQPARAADGSALPVCEPPAGSDPIAAATPDELAVLDAEMALDLSIGRATGVRVAGLGAPGVGGFGLSQPGFGGTLGATLPVSAAAAPFSAPVVPLPDGSLRPVVDPAAAPGAPLAPGLVGLPGLPTGGQAAAAPGLAPANGAAANGALANGAAAPGAAPAAPALPPIARQILPPVQPLRRPPPVLTVELGFFLSTAAAESFAASLQRRGIEVMIVEEPDATGRVWSYVRSGRFSDSAQALAYAAEIERTQRLPTTVVAERTVTAP
jgi:hypothetical protein